MHCRHVYQQHDWLPGKLSAEVTFKPQRIFPPPLAALLITLLVHRSPTKQRSCRYTKHYLLHIYGSTPQTGLYTFTSTQPTKSTPTCISVSVCNSDLSSLCCITSRPPFAFLSLSPQRINQYSSYSTCRLPGDIWGLSLIHRWLNH